MSSHRIKKAMKYLVKTRVLLDNAMEACNERVRAKRPPTARIIDAVLAADKAVYIAIMMLSDETQDYSILNRPIIAEARQKAALRKAAAEREKAAVR